MNNDCLTEYIGRIESISVQSDGNDLRLYLCFPDRVQIKIMTIGCYGGLISNDVTRCGIALLLPVCKLKRITKKKGKK